jgi:hypothetical protein
MKMEQTDLPTHQMKMEQTDRPTRQMKMEQTDCSETLAYKIQTPGNYTEESIQLSLVAKLSCLYFTESKCVGLNCCTSPTFTRTAKKVIRSCVTHPLHITGLLYICNFVRCQLKNIYEPMFRAPSFKKVRLMPPCVNSTFWKASACFISNDVSYPTSEEDEDIVFAPLQCKEIQEMQLMYHWLYAVQMANMQYHMDRQVILRKLCFTDSPSNMWGSDVR